MMKKQHKKGGLQLSINFVVILIICIVIFSSSLYIIKKFFTHAEEIRMAYDERTEMEIERLLDDGSRVAIPFDKKKIYIGEFDTFGIGILNMLGINPAEFKITIEFNKAFDKDNDVVCATPPPAPVGPQPPAPNTCGDPNTWLQTTEYPSGPLTIIKSIKNNEQEKFLLGINVQTDEPGTYIFDLEVCYKNSNTENVAQGLYDSYECECWEDINIGNDLPPIYVDDPPCQYRHKDNRYGFNKLYVEVP